MLNVTDSNTLSEEQKLPNSQKNKMSHQLVYKRHLKDNYTENMKIKVRKIYVEIEIIFKIKYGGIKQNCP